MADLNVPVSIETLSKDLRASVMAHTIADIVVAALTRGKAPPMSELMKAAHRWQAEARRVAVDGPSDALLEADQRLVVTEVHRDGGNLRGGGS